MQITVDKGMEREYQWARRIIAILAIIISFFVLINEDISLKLVGICIFTGVAWLTCFLGAGVSRKMIEIGDKISNVFFRVLYYILLLLFVPILAIGFWFLINYMYDVKAQSYNFEPNLGQALLLLLLGASFFVFVLVPYVQSLLVLILRGKLKKESVEE